MKAGTRESRLAMRQTQMFKEYMADMAPEVEIEIVGMTSSGDRDLTTPLKDMGGQGVFVRELDEALLDGRVDVTVNSLKDVPVKMTPGLVVGAVLPRDDPRDCIVPVPLDDIACGAIVGTSSQRRALQLRTIDPKLRIKDIRGNVDTRMAKMEAGEYRAILMAYAGMERLGMEAQAHPIPKNKMIPAASQGAIAIECRADDEETLRILGSVDDAKTRAEVSIERDILRLMDAGCSSPIGINAELKGRTVHLLAVSFDYTPTPARVDMTFPLSERDEKVREVADRLLGKAR